MAQLNISLTDEDHQAIRQAAHEAHAPSLSGWVRDRCLGEPQEGESARAVEELRLRLENQIEELDSRLSALEGLANG